MCRAFDLGNFASDGTASSSLNARDPIGPSQALHLEALPQIREPIAACLPESGVLKVTESSVVAS